MLLFLAQTTYSAVQDSHRRALQRRGRRSAAWSCIQLYLSYSGPNNFGTEIGVTCLAEEAHEVAEYSNIKLFLLSSYGHCRQSSSSCGHVLTVGLLVLAISSLWFLQVSGHLVEMLYQNQGAR